MHTYSLKRWLLLSTGWLAIILAAAGVILPLLPTTPFVLLAACCFMKSSPATHQRLLQHPKLGPILLDWQQHRCIRRDVKLKAFAVIVLSFSLSIYLVPHPHLKLMLLAIGLIVFGCMYRLPERN